MKPSRRALALGLGALLGALAFSAASADDGFVASGKKAHRKAQKPPVKLGSSMGNNEAVEPVPDMPGFVSCESGTGGALILKNGKQYVMSNNHVFALSNKAKKGDPIGQPGLIDINCNKTKATIVAHLTGYQKIKFGNKNNKADVAIAEVVPGMVVGDGAQVGIGDVGSGIVASSAIVALGTNVEKAGRTTGKTRGKITGLGMTVNVGFEGKTARFVNQIFIESVNRKPFSIPGDSGSAIYTRANCGQFVGLLFAGNDVITAANTPGDVMAAVNKIKPRGPMSFVGGCTAAAATQEVKMSAQLRRSMRAAKKAQKRVESRVMAQPGVIAFGIGLSSEDAEAAVLKVYVEDAAKADVPAELEGVRTEVVETEPFQAL